MMLISMSFIALGCSSNEKVVNKIVLPQDIPEFVQVSDFTLIDWERKAVRFGDRNRINGNENKSGVIGADMPSLDIQKWMWHLWGVERANLTIVGFHRETSTIHKILKGGWSGNASGANNGADAHMPSLVKIPIPGEWAILLYTDEKLFDILVYEVTN